MMVIRFHFRGNSMHKKCFKCNEVKALDSFYKHSKMNDGRVNKCIECTKKDVIKNRLDKIEYYRSYDKARASKPSRVIARKLYRETEEGKLAVARAHRTYAETFPERRKAQHILGNAIRDKKIEKQPCFVCGKEKVEAHHFDYSRPLLVTWLCNYHHRQTHELAKEFKQAA